MKNKSRFNPLKSVLFAVLMVSISCQSEIDSEKQALKERATQNAEKFLANPPKWNQGITLNNTFVSDYSKKIPFGNF